MYIIDLSLVKKIHDVGHHHGGIPYGVGLWNTPYINRMFAPPAAVGAEEKETAAGPPGDHEPGQGLPPTLVE